MIGSYCHTDYTYCSLVLIVMFDTAMFLLSLTQTTLVENIRINSSKRLEQLLLLCVSMTFFYCDCAIIVAAFSL